MIRKVGSEWCVFSKDGSKNLGCKPSEEAAKKRLQQIEFFKRQMEANPELSEDDKIILMDDVVLYELADAYVDLEGAPVMFQDGEVRLAEDIPRYGVTPEVWSPQVAEKYWNSVGGSMATCMTKLGGDKGAGFCASLKNYVLGDSEWRISEEEGEMEPVIHSKPVLLAEESAQEEEQWVDLLLDGEYVSMDGQPVAITPTQINAMIKNFKQGTRGQDIPITIDHPDKGGGAAGWIKRVRKTPRQLGDEAKTCLQGLIKWTPFGRDKVDNQEYRYISSELMGDVLRAASLVNFPAIKGMNPVTPLAEKNQRHIYLTEDLEGGDNDMADEYNEQDEAIVELMAQKIVKKVKEDLHMDDWNGGSPPTKETPEVEGTDTNEHNMLLLENIADEKVRPLMEENSKQKKMLEEAQTQLATLLSEQRVMKLREKAQTAATISPTKKYAPKIVQLLEEVLLAEPTEYETKVMAFLEGLKGENAIIDLAEVGHSRDVATMPEVNTKAWSDEANRLAEQIMAEKHIPYRQAAKLAYQRLMES